MMQGSAEWFAARCGKVTASKLADLTAKTKSGWSASRANYMAQLIAERLTGLPAESFSNAAMQWGTATEPQARAAYSFLTDKEVAEVGFIEHPSIPMTGASPDGMIGDDGLVEIKCPNTSTHLDTLLGSDIDGKYTKQMHWQMACTGRKWCDFVSFDPRMPADLQIKIHRVERDDGLIASLEADVKQFLVEVDEKMDELNKLREAI
jgi:putative phage-type endonuclease